MNDSPKQISWRGEPAVEFASGAARAVVVAGRGGKIVSLRDATGAEWLAQLPPGPWPTVATDGNFTDAEMCGWDECAPSIVACKIGGADVPDHGDLWRQVWQAQGAAAGVTGPSLGYRFTRRIEPIAGGFAFHYEVASDVVTPFLWAAHPQFLAPPGSYAALDHGGSVLDTTTEPHTEVPWNPSLASIDTVPTGGCRKFYLLADRGASSAELVHADGRRLRLAWEAAVVPYVGLWFDGGIFAPQNVIAIEPSTGFYDDLAKAAAANRVATVGPEAPLKWSLAVTFP